MLYYGLALAIFILLSCDVKTKAFARETNQAINEYYLVAFAFFVVLFVLLSGFRWKTGGDWAPYENLFNDSITWPQFARVRYELLYKVLSFLVKRLFNSYTLLLFVIGFLTISLKIKWIYTFSLIPGLSLFLYFCIRNADIFTERNDIAKSLCLLSTIYINRRDKTKFIITTIFAVLFHKSSLVWFLSYSIFHSRFSARFIIIVLICAFTINILMSRLLTVLTTLIRILFVFNSSFGEYVVKYVVKDIPMFPPILSLIKKMGMVLLILTIRDRVCRKDAELNGFVNLFLFGEIANLVFLGGAGTDIFRSAFIVYSMTEIIVIPNVYYRIKIKYVKPIILLLILCYGILRVWLALEQSKLWGMSFMDPYMSIFNYNPSIR